VDDLLSRSAAYWQLDEDRRKAVAADMNKVAQYIVGGQTGDNVPRSARLVGAPAAARSLANRPYDPAGQTAGERFAQGGGAVAAQQGPAAFNRTRAGRQLPRLRGGAHRRGLQRHRHRIDQADGRLPEARGQRCEIRRRVHEGQHHGERRP